MIANARMYGINPQVADLWAQLVQRLIAISGRPVEAIEHRPPAPIAELWARPEKAAVMMCGLPFSTADHPVEALAAAIPSPARYAGRPQYWSDLVVRADAPYHTLADTFGGRIALTVPDSQSGCVAALHEVMAQAPAGTTPYARIIGPAITPQGAMKLVAEGEADIAPIDSYAHDLLRRYQPELASRVRILVSTSPTPNPLFVANPPAAPELRAALLSLHQDVQARPLLDALLIDRYVAVAPADYQMLAERAATARGHWAAIPFSTEPHPAFPFGRRIAEVSTAS